MILGGEGRVRLLGEVWHSKPFQTLTCITLVAKPFSSLLQCSRRNIAPRGIRFEHIQSE